MLTCPTCGKPVLRGLTAGGPVGVCRFCGGRAVSIAVLKRTASEDFLRRLRHGSPHRGQEASRKCPACERMMWKADFGYSGRALILDVCHGCQLIWLDAGEHIAAGPRESPEPPGPGDDRSALALAGPDSLWQFLPGVLGLPIEYGPNRLRDKAITTWCLVGIMVVTMLLLSSPVMGGNALAAAIARWGLIPAQWSRNYGLTVLTSFFLHAGWWHLIANAYFLVVFGDNVEDHLRPVRYLLLLATAHVGGMFLHSTLSVSQNLPCVGASAGISGVLAYYAIRFSRAKVGIFGGIFTLLHFLRMPAWAALGAYAVIQAVSAYAARGVVGGGGVAYLAHLGGLAVGVLWALGSLVQADRCGR